MTLSTDFYILDKADPREVFAECQRLLAQYDEQKRTPAQHRFEDKPRDEWVDGAWVQIDGGPWSVANEPFQDLPAWLFVHYRPGAALRTPEQSAEHDEDICTLPDSEWWVEGESTECDGTYHDQACWINVDFDTAYSYRGPNRMGCGDFHAALVSQLGQWCDQRGLRWKWRNEYTGQVHEGYAALAELVADGFAGTAWFQTSVMPFIAAEIAGRGEQS